MSWNWGVHLGRELPGRWASNPRPPTRTGGRNNIELFELLQSNGVIAGHLIHEEHAYNDPHLNSRDFFVEVKHPEAGTHLYPSTAFKMSKIPFEVRKPPVRLGEDNEYIYKDVLGFTEKEYIALEKSGQIGMDYAPHVR